MARKKEVVLTPEEELKQIVADIQQTRETLKSLEKSKKELEEKIKIDRLAALDELITQSGKSYDEVKALLSE